MTNRLRALTCAFVATAPEVPKARGLRAVLRGPAAALLGLAVVLSGCAPASMPDVPERRAAFDGPLPPMKSFAGARTAPTIRSNRELAADFLDLSFQMESGRRLVALSRYEGPVRVGVRGPAPASLGPDLNALLNRLRTEAGVDIARAGDGEAANLIVEVLPRRELQRLVPQAACFVVPRVKSWEEFRRARRSRDVDWTTLTTRTQAAIFLPGDVSPQEIRDCLHEEIAQALGPLNDLYRLPDSVFNDDNFHTVLTGFDMLMLRITYDRALQSGLSRAEVASRLPSILARLNPRGQGLPGRRPAPTPRDWQEAIETALGPRANPAQRQNAARRAVQIAQTEGWRGTRRAFSLYALGRLSLSTDPELALASFLEAGAIYRARSDTRIQAAHVAMQLAAFSLSAGQVDGTLSLVEDSLPAVSASQNAALLATLLLIKAEALELDGQAARAAAVQEDALGWARYGFGSDAVVRARASEIASLGAPRLASADTGG
ncbi:MAG: DUF2927 domain-containing protein [Pseudomonadota bacterium]